MIHNDEELNVVREQLQRAESALLSLRRDILPQNERLYRLMAESYVDTILELRGQVDAYLEISAMPENADLVISLEGDRVGLGRTSAAVVTRFIDTFRRGIQSAVEIVESASEQRVGRRRERWIENICDLSILGLGPGSLKVMLAEPQDQSLFSTENRESLHKALDLVFDGLHWADGDVEESGARPFTELPVQTQQAILALVTQLLPPQTGDVQQVRFRRRIGSETSTGRESAILSRNSRPRIRAALEKMLPDSEFKEIVGIIRKLDLDDRSFTLRDRADDGADLRCEYGPELEDAVKEFLDIRVVVTGSLEINRKQKAKLLADSIEPANEEVNEI